MHIQGKKKSLLTMYTTQHYNSLTLLYLNSQLISKFQTNSIFTLKKKTLTDKHNYLPLKKYAIHISTKREKKKEKKRRRQNSTHREWRISIHH